MKNRQVVVELLPDRIDVVVREGSRRSAFRRIPITAPSDACEWAKSVRRSAATLKAAVEEMSLTGCPATVLYRSPTQAVELGSFPSTSGSQACEAAMLSCTDALPYSAMSAVCEAAVAGRDAAGEGRQTHVVVAAEREDVADAIVELIRGAGLRFVSATPLDAAVIAHLVSSTLREKKANQGVLYVGERTSVFVIAGGGRLLFNRRIDLGLESLAQSLTRPIRAAGQNEPIELDIDAARSILHAHGIPGHDTIVEETNGLTGAQVIPLIQPALQRFIVELRQSLRFGLSEDERERLAIRVTGPGSALPGFAALIKGELGTEARTDPGRVEYDFAQRSIDGSELIDALGDRNLLSRLNLQPSALARQRRIGRLRRWLWTGAAAALTLIAMDGFHYHADLADARRQADAIASQIADLEAMKTTSEKLVDMLQAMNDLEARIDEEIGSPVDHRACLQELSRITPESIRFTSIAFQRLDGATVATLTGYAFCAEGGSGRTDLERFIECLRDSPMFADIELGSVTAGVFDEREGQRFETSFTAGAAEPDRRIAAAEGGADR